MAEPKYEIVMDPRYIVHKDEEGRYCRTEINKKCTHGISLLVAPNAEMIVLTQAEDAQVISMAFQVKEE